MIHLDTNVLVSILRGKAHKVRARFEEHVESGAPLAVSTIVYHELLHGAAVSARPHENATRIAILFADARVSVVAFSGDDASEAAAIRADLHRGGVPIGPYDALIAAQARAAGVPLVTANTREFVRVPGLVVVDWAR